MQDLKLEVVVVPPAPGSAQGLYLIVSEIEARNSCADANVFGGQPLRWSSWAAGGRRRSVRAVVDPDRPR